MRCAWREARQPDLKRAHANTQAAAARSAQAHAPLFPQLEASAGYQRTTANFVPRPGQLPGGLQASEDPDFDLFDYFTFSLSARQLVYDFGLSYGRAEAAEAEAGAEQATSARLSPMSKRTCA